MPLSSSRISTASTSFIPHARRLRRRALAEHGRLSCRAASPDALRGASAVSSRRVSLPTDSASTLRSLDGSSSGTPSGNQGDFAEHLEH